MCINFIFNISALDSRRRRDVGPKFKSAVYISSKVVVRNFIIDLVFQLPNGVLPSVASIGHWGYEGYFPGECSRVVCKKRVSNLLNFVF